MSRVNEQEFTGDTTHPSVARAYDYVLGGRHNFPVDREAIAGISEGMPQELLPDAARTTRRALVRAVRYLAETAGIRQFLDLGSGLPTMENTHEVARRYQPDARVVYVDLDPTVRAHGAEFMADDQNTSLITADLRDHERILTDPDLTRLLDLSEPVAVILLGVLHYCPDGERPDRFVAGYRDALAPGSHLFLGQFCRYGPDDAALEQAFIKFLGGGWFRTAAEIESFFAGFELIEPGVVPLGAWRPDQDEPDLLSAAGRRLMAGGMGRKP